jgi:hypothetical protein
MPKPPPIYITDIINISTHIQLLGQIAIQQYEVKSLANSQVKGQFTVPDCYGMIVKSLAEKQIQVIQCCLAQRVLPGTMEGHTDHPHLEARKNS